MAILIAIAIALFVCGSVAFAQPEEKRFYPTAPQAYDYLGTSVDISGDVMIAGAPGDSVVGAKHAGAAYLYRFDGVNWNFEQRVISTSPKADARHGSGVAIDGQYAAITGTDEVQTFHYNGSSWVPGQLIPIAFPQTTAAQSISMDTGVMVVGRQFSGGAAGGEAYVFRNIGGTWVQEQILLSPGAYASASFGTSVSIHGGRIAVGAPLSNSPVSAAAGMVFLHQWDGNSWVPEANLHAADGDYEDWFGHRVELDDDQLIIGAPNANSPGHLWSGAAYVMRKDAAWVLEQRLDASHTSFWGQFGNAVAIEDDVLVVGAKIGLYTSNGGAAFVYQRSGTQWTNDRALSAGNPSDASNFGASVALDDETVVAGAPWSSFSPFPLVGSAHIFDLNTYPGCPGSNGKVPKLVVPDQMSIGGTSGNLFIYNSVVNGIAFVAVSPVSGSLPLNGGCVLETLPPLVLLGPIPLGVSGDYVTAFPIPASVPPTSVTVQIVITDPGAQGRVTTTGRVDVTLQ